LHLPDALALREPWLDLLLPIDHTHVAKRAALGVMPAFRHRVCDTLPLEVTSRVEAAQICKPYATVDRHGHRLRARAPRSPDRRGRRQRDAWRRCVGD
jgi:hypothetical protein